MDFRLAIPSTEKTNKMFDGIISPYQERQTFKINLGFKKKYLLDTVYSVASYHNAKQCLYQFFF